MDRLGLLVLGLLIGLSQKTATATLPGSARGKGKRPPEVADVGLEKIFGSGYSTVGHLSSG